MKSFLTLSEMKGSRAIKCSCNNHGRYVNKYGSKVVSICRGKAKHFQKVDGAMRVGDTQCQSHFKVFQLYQKYSIM